MNKALQVLIVEDSECDARLLVRELRRGGYDPVYERVETAEMMDAALERQAWDLIISDYVMPRFSGPSALKLMQDKELDLPFIIVSGNIGEDIACESMKAGAHDYILKSNLSRLVPAIRRELRQAEVRRGRQESESKYRAIFETTGSAMVIVEADTTISLANEEFAKLSGFSKEEVEGKKRWTEFFSQGCLDRIKEYHRLRRIDPDAAPRQYEAEFVDRHGAVKNIIINVSMIPGTKQSVASFLDITERKQAEEQLRLCSEVLDNVSAGILVVAADGMVHAVNPAFTSITGYAKEEVVARDGGPLFFNHYESDKFNKLISSIKETGHYHGEALAHRKNGANYLEGFTITAIMSDRGEVTHYIKVFQDITEAAKLREDKRRIQGQTAQMHKLASLSALSAGVVHEIAQPLNSISVLAEGMLYVLNRGKDLNPDKAREKLQHIAEEIDRINGIIKHIRSFAQGGHTELVPCSVNKAVNNALDLLGSQLAAHGINVKTDLAGNLADVMGTCNDLEEVVVNLLVNAMEALDTTSRNEKEIALTTCQVDRRVVLYVADNATGIDSEIRDRIFEPLFSTKNPDQAMGLGLSIVKSIVEKLNGSILVCNNEKGGATFRVELPALQDG